MSDKELFSNIGEYLTSANFYASLVVFVIAIVVLYVIKQYLIKKVAYTTKDEQHKNTFKGVLYNILQYFVVIAAAVIILQLNGVNITSILAGLGIFATIIGLALQDTLKDIFAGINIYNNNFYKVGDMVRYNGEECDVKYFSARVTKFQSIATKSTYTVNNSLINSIEKIKDGKFISISIPFETDREKIDNAFKRVEQRAKEECDRLNSASYIGPFSIDEHGVNFGLGFSCPAHKYYPIRNAITNIIYEEFKKEGISPAFDEDYLPRQK